MGSATWARRAMISTSNPLAVEAGLWALSEGGTAMDAAIASDAVLGVVQPFSTGIGGDAFCIVDDGREPAGFNGSGAAPAGLTLERFAADCLAEHPEQTGPLRDTSPLSVTVPGAVDAWDQLQARYGRLPLRTLLEPARRLAADGFPVTRHAAAAWTESGVRLRGGAPHPIAVHPGQRVVNPDLAASLEEIAAGGAPAHYSGGFGRAVVDAVTRDGGVLSLDDLAAHRGEWVVPLRGGYRDIEVCQLPPNGQGASVLAALQRLERHPAGVAATPDDVAATLVCIREGMRLAYRYVADPREAEVPHFWSGRDTVYTAVHADGMSVSLISSIYYGFGSGIAAGGSALQNRGCGFSADPAHPNCVAPGRRPFHTIIPALLRCDGRAWAVLGCVGGPMQPQGQVQLISHLVDRRLDPQAALDEPRLAWLGGDRAALEPGFEPEVAEAVRAAGFDVDPMPLPASSAGGGQIVIVHADGWLEGGADQRKDGVALGR